MSKKMENPPVFEIDEEWETLAYEFCLRIEQEAKEDFNGEHTISSFQATEAAGSVLHGQTKSPEVAVKK